MRVKPKIDKRDGSWRVQRPPFGFRSTPDVTKHESFADAVGSMTQTAEHYAPGGSAERQPPVTDQIASVPMWTPFEYRAT